MTEFLSYDTIAFNVAKIASRAMGLVIYKSKLNGGFPYDCFSKLYHSLVWSVIDYGSCIWGTNRRNCIEALSPTGSALARTDLSPLTNGNWVIHAEYSCFLHPPFLAKIG